VSVDIEGFGFNTAIAALMELKNTMQKLRSTTAGSDVWDESIRTLLVLMAPFVPHIAEELWERTGGKYSIHQQAWPVYDEAIAAEEMVTYPVQVNGKLRDRITVPADANEETIKAAALASARVQEFLNGGQPKNVIVIPGRLVNIVM
jgi:leucyl-tRNA synthetase